jgi:UDP-N-acetyl-D-glucosamine dehydrogenase
MAAVYFKERVESMQAVVGVIGLGYVGIPLVLAVNDAGFRSIGFDIDAARVDGLNAGLSPIRQIASARIASLRSDGFEATTDFARAAECDALLICVPTPLDEFREPDLSFVVNTMEMLKPYLRKGHMVSLESTTWPGTTQEVLLPYLEQAGLSVGEDGFLVYSPEREDPGNATYHTRNIPKVLGGHTPACLEMGTALYSAFIDKVVPVSSTMAAEMVKLLENIQRSVNIGLMNEIKIVAERMGLDIFEVIDAAKTKPFGFTPYYPGPGIGGHCIPIDPFYLTWKAREYGLHTRFIELAGEINASMPQHVVARTVRALNSAGKCLSGAKIIVLGIAYKRDVDDVRESPSVLVMEHLRNWGADISYADPHVLDFPKMRKHRFDLSSIELTPETVAVADAVLLLTDHSAFDYEMIRSNARILIDTRGRYRGDQGVTRA